MLLNFIQRQELLPLKPGECSLLRPSTVGTYIERPLDLPAQVEEALLDIDDLELEDVGPER